MTRKCVARLGRRESVASGMARKGVTLGMTRKSVARWDDEKGVASGMTRKGVARSE